MRDEGLYLGGSTAINIAGAMAMARDLGPGHTIVTILCDSGQRYQSKVWNPAFLREKNLPVPSWLEVEMAPVLVSAEWLLDNIDNVRVFDISHLPTVKRDAEARCDAHIPGARRFGIAALWQGHPMPHGPLAH